MILISKMHKTTNLILDIRLVETKKSKLSILTSTRRNIYGSTHEKRRHENRKSHLLCRTIRYHNRNRSLLWSHHRIHIYPNHILMSKLCSRSHAIHRIPENLYQKLTPYTMEEWQPFGNILGFLIGIFATGI